MYVTLVHVQVKPEHLGDFVEATVENHKKSIQEAGNVRFDVLQSADDPCRFIIYEAYESPEDAGAHKGTEHYLKWREAVADWMAAPRTGVVYRGICP
ncbi:MAG: antibiotic biosynthesis monooxygenase [Armatimonadota bacterium]|nr:antibiotic biosynthesis monooxygenase [Armatimonadota bacterium]